MKPESTDERHRRAVEAQAAQYANQGYSVIAEPSPEATPEFLRSYAPDIIATKGDERWVIEVKTPGHKRQAGFWAGLARKVAETGWHFRIVVADAGEGDARSYAMPEAAEIEAGLASPAKLVAEGMEGPALMLSWSLFEAAARRRLLRDDQDPERPETPLGLAKTLVFLGHVDERELDELREIARLRNQVAHGSFKAKVPAGSIELLTALTRRLLEEEAAA
jgi:hypothetical protein